MLIIIVSYIFYSHNTSRNVKKGSSGSVAIDFRGSGGNVALGNHPQLTANYATRDGMVM